jgi:diacylglycerol kinase (ATP)
VDLGYCKLLNGTEEQQRYFNNNLGIGFEAQVTRESQKIKYFPGMAVYILAVFQALRHYTPQYLNLEWQSVTGEMQAISQPILLISFGNSYRNGGGFSINKNAKLDDGLLDFCFAPEVSRPKILNLLLKVIFGTHIHDPIVRQQQCRKAGIYSSQNILIHADGELLVADDLYIELQPQRLEVIVN